MAVELTEILFEKQRVALAALSNSTPVTEVVYGGAAGGGKSLLGCAWQIARRLKYPGTRGLLGRAKLKRLKETTLNTFFETAKRDFGLEAGKHYTVNNQSDVITFFNGSQILMKDLFYYPSDPNFDSLGSLEITDAFIDEIPEITYKAWSIVKSRCRYKVSDDLKGVILGTCNPAKGWVYDKFYKPSIEGKLLNYRAFIQSLPQDNPHLPKQYIESLQTLPEEQRKRLLEGNWEYDDSIDRLFRYDDLIALYRPEKLGGKKYITADVARLGKDKTVIGIWDGLSLIEIVSIPVSRVNETVDAINRIRKEHSVNLSNIVVDEDGVGGGVVDYLKGCRGFTGGSSAIVNKRCINLRSECYFKLAEFVESNKITILTKSKQDEIVQELDSTRRKHPELDDKKLQIISKEEIKRMNGGKSPDYADMIMMRMYFELRPNYGQYAVG